MTYLPQMASISDMKHEHLKVLAMLDQGPVVLASRNQPVGVLLSPKQWEKLMERIEEQQDVIDVLEAKFELANGSDSIEELDDIEIQSWLGISTYVPA